MLPCHHLLEQVSHGVLILTLFIAFTIPNVLSGFKEQKRFGESLLMHLKDIVLLYGIKSGATDGHASFLQRHENMVLHPNGSPMT